MHLVLQTVSKDPLIQHSIKLLKVSSITRNLKLARCIHARLIMAIDRTRKDRLTQENSLLDAYMKCGWTKIAHELFVGMPERNIVSWSTLMAGYLRDGISSEVINLFKAMIFFDHLCPNEYVTAIALSSCSINRRLHEGRQFHGQVLKSGLLFYQYVKNALLQMYIKCSDICNALVVFDTLTEWDMVSYNSFMNGLLEHGYLQEAMVVVAKMVDQFAKWDKVTYISIFGVCARLKNLKLALQVHNQMAKTGIELDVFIGSSIIDMYGRCGKLLNAKNAFSHLTTQNVASWTAIIAAYFQNGCFEEALKLFLIMELEYVLPNEYTFAVLINCCAGLGSLTLGDLFHSRIMKLGYYDYVLVGNSLINMYLKSGCSESAEKVFLCMRYRDIITWNSIISGFSQHGFGLEALHLFHEMLNTYETPNAITFLGVLTACCHLGRVDEGFYYLNHLMKQNGVEPRLEHHTCIVGLLSKAGQLRKAENYMRCTPIKWDVIAWRSLLNGCVIHQNYKLGKRVAELILHIDPHDVGSYILLSNICAKAKRWDGVASMRKLMRERNIKKEPGASWMDIRNSTHIFTSESNKHPESPQIYEKVKELLAKIKPLGYVPNVTSVLHDVEDEQREEYLVYHSEKLAIAYGVMKMPPGAPIRIFKNIRICDDCHSAAKFISKMVNRMIVVRDANRFHTFKDGFCSCGDYW